MLSDLTALLKRCHWIPERGLCGKRCAICKDMKDARDFGSSNYCKKCEKEWKKDWYWRGRR